MVKKKNKIIHFILDHRLGGPHTYVKNICEGLKKDYLFDISTTGNGPLTDIALFNLRKYNKILYPLEILINVVLIILLIRKEKNSFNIIFDVHGISNIAPLIASRILNVKLVWHIHETLNFLSFFYYFGNAILRKSKFELVYIAKKAKKVFNINSGKYIPGCVSINYWKIETKKNSKKGYNKTILFIGNLNPLKGLDILLDALKIISKPYKLVVIGSILNTHKKYFNSILNKIEKINERHVIKILDWQPKVEIKKYLNIADIFILPSRSEASPISLLEAMSMEKVCLASRVGDIPVIIDNGINGFLIDRLSPIGIVNKLSEINKLSEMKQKNIQEMARKKILENYSMKKFLSAHKNLYNKINNI